MPNKIIVAVHGIGDHVRCETIQAVAYQVSRYYRQPAGIPLGRLHTDLVQLDDGPPPSGVYVVNSAPLKGLGFAEVYWADIPRGPAKDRYTLEESKRWGRTVVERIRALDRQSRFKLTDESLATLGTANVPEQVLQKLNGLKDVESGRQQFLERLAALLNKGERTQFENLVVNQAHQPLHTEEEYKLVTQVIDELIEGVRSIERLLFLARAANVMSFDLRKLLVDYLGDVQVVAEFGNFRNRILTGFQQVLSTVHEKDKTAELYIVAHSEGTVIAFLGILQALRREPLDPLPKQKAPPKPDWVKQLRGFMTIGSPLNKHLFLWPDLFQERAVPPEPAVWKERAPSLGQDPATRIQWRNYYDLGDPIGFQLNQMRKWLRDTKWERFFDFQGPVEASEVKTYTGPKHDIGFTRYLFPGKAHTDYWTDEEVFGHFIQDVVKPPADPEDPNSSSRTYPPPGDRALAKRVSPLVPYVLAAGLLALGVFLLYSAVTAFTLIFSERVDEKARNVAGITLVLAGASAAARIPRVTKSKRWRWGGYLFFLGSLVAYPFLLTCAAKARLGSPVIALLGSDNPALMPFNWAAENLSVLPVCEESTVPGGATLATLTLVAATLVLIALVSRWRPLWGVKPLIACGAMIIFGIVFVRLTTYQEFLKNKAHVTNSVIDKTRVPERIQEEVTFKLHNLHMTKGGAKTFGDFVQDDKEAQKVLGSLPPALPPPQAKKAAPQEENKAPGDDEDHNGASDERPLWPIVLAGLAFLYLWWVAAIAFDLAVVWQHYVRRAAILNRLKALDPTLRKAKA